METKNFSASLTILALSVVFGLIACFANTQSVVIILLYGALSLMYAGRAAALEDFLYSFEEMMEGNFIKTTVSVINHILEISLCILTIVSIAGLVWGIIELSFINLLGIIWFIGMNIITVIITEIALKNSYEEDENVEEIDEENY